MPFLRSNPRSLIINADRDATVAQTSSRQNNLGTGFLAVSNRVGDEIRENAFDKQRICVDCQRQRTREKEKTFGRRDRRKFSGKFVKKFRHIDVFHLDIKVSGFNTAHFQKLFDQRGNVLCRSPKLCDDIL